MGAARQVAGGNAGQGGKNRNKRRRKVSEPCSYHLSSFISPLSHLISPRLVELFNFCELELGTYFYPPIKKMCANEKCTSHYQNFLPLKNIWSIVCAILLSYISWRDILDQPTRTVKRHQLSPFHLCRRPNCNSLLAKVKLCCIFMLALKITSYRF